LGPAPDPYTERSRVNVRRANLAVRGGDVDFDDLADQLCWTLHIYLTIQNSFISSSSQAYLHLSAKSRTNSSAQLNFLPKNNLYWFDWVYHWSNRKLSAIVYSKILLLNDLIELTKFIICSFKKIQLKQINICWYYFLFLGSFLEEEPWKR